MNSFAKCLALCAIAMCGRSGNAAYDVDSAFRNALTEGALLELTLSVQDEAGKPVGNAKVRATLADRDADHSQYGVTDKDGFCHVSGRTTGDYIEFEVSADGFYASRRRLSYIEMGNEHKVIDGKWQPVGAVETMQMRKIVQPEISCVGGRFVFTRKLGTWIGFDLKKGDFVCPHGNGEISDFEVILDWDGRWIPDYSGMGVRIRFVAPYSGFYEVAMHGESVFKWPYLANSQGVFAKDAEFFEKIESDFGRIHRHFAKDRCWVVRSRCQTGENGELVSANYSVVHKVRFCGKKDGRGGLLIEGAFNPVPNDTNLEPKR